MPRKKLQPRRGILKLETDAPPLRCLSIGGVVVRFEPRGEISPWSYDRIHREFIGEEGPLRLRLRLHVGPLPPLGWSRLRYEGNRLWAVRECSSGFLLVAKGPSRRATPSRVALLERDWTQGDLYVRVDAVHSGAGRYPLEFPLEVVLFPALLGHYGGLVPHAAGAIRDGRAFVFAGRSGSGKTTIARLLRDAGFTVLSDERVIVRLDGGAVVVYGSPWPGEMEVASARSAPLAALFHLEHGTSTRTERLSVEEAAAALLPRCRLPFWDRRAMEGLLATIGDITARVPAYRLEFVPDQSVVALVEGMEAGMARE